MDDTKHCAGSWITGVSGRPIFFEEKDFYRNVYDIREIAHALSCTCRFNGHVVRPYSVAQHCVLCADNVASADVVHPDDVLLLRQAALLHDAAEAFIGDIVRPLKRMLPLFMEIEHRFEREIHKAFGLPEVLPEWVVQRVKEIDNIVLATERRDLLPVKSQEHNWGVLETFPPLKSVIYALDQRNAADLFLHRARDLNLLHGDPDEFVKHLRYP